MIKENQDHLRNLGVSHPSLEMIVAATSTEPFNLATKLTGAGGGGCAVTLIPDSEYRLATCIIDIDPLLDFPDASLGSLQAALRNMGFEPHLTSLGVPGVGILQSSPSQTTSAPSPSASTDAIPTGEGMEQMVVPKRAGLRDAGKDGLQTWADGLGEWCFT